MKKNQLIKLLLFLGLILLGIIFIFAFPRVSLPFGFSYILFLMARPLTLKLTIGTKTQRLLASIIFTFILSSLLVPIIVSLYRVDTNFSELYKEVPFIKSTITQKYIVFKNFIFQKFGYDIKIDPVGYIFESIESFASLIVLHLPKYISAVFEWFLLVPIFLYFFFKESRKFNLWVVQIIPNSIFEKTYVLFSQFNTKFGEYIIAKFIEASIMGILIGTGLFLFDFPYAFIFAFIAAITNILPYIGPLIGFLPPLLFTLVSKDVNTSLFAISLVFGIANLIDMVLVFPLLVSKIVNLHPIIVIISIIIGSQIGGMIGMIVIIPFIAFFKILFREIYKDLTVHT